MLELDENDIAELSSYCPDGIRRNVDLSKISRWKSGGEAALIVQPADAGQLQQIIRWFAIKGVQPLVIGQTSNLLFDDAGLNRPCIQITTRMSNIDIDGELVIADAGVWVPRFARTLMGRGLSGAEHVCGIPGTLGGLICMNGGSQRKGIGSSVTAVESIDMYGERHVRTASECGFTYRDSVFQSNDEIVTRAQLRFDLGGRAEIRKKMLKILSDRRKKFPLKIPNCGSVFKSNPALYNDLGPPGKIIESIGLMGMTVGSAVVSPAHANFIVNTGGATSSDILTLINDVSTKVKEATGYMLEAEVYYVSADGMKTPANLITGQ